MVIFYDNSQRFKIGDYLDFLEGDRFYEKSDLNDYDQGLKNETEKNKGQETKRNIKN
jgi:hypothetical protein